MLADYQSLLKPDQKEMLDEKLRQLNQLRPISPTMLRQLKERFQVEMTYNSNAIEGNTLTLNETYWVIQEGITVSGKPLKDHLEAKNHKEALDYLYQLVEEERLTSMTEGLIKKMHHYVLSETDPGVAGKYREVDVRISGTDFKPVSAMEVEAKMAMLVEWVANNAPKPFGNGQLHLVEFVAIFHYLLAMVHPFQDGNGRTARLAMNLFLMKAGYPLVIILMNDRKKYYRVMREADKGKFANLVTFVAQAVIRSLNIYLDTLTPTKRKEGFVSLAKLAEQTTYSQEYLSKLAKLGKIDAHKEKRNWVSTMSAIEEYVQKHGGRVGNLEF